ncbi:MAG TPA: hypothetical protein VKG84_00005 [Candidatus Acidoferrales bacterium]|nr:hypothetical protein [Candidatus Acidoferrales bacterium]
MRKLALPMIVLGLTAVTAVWASGGPGDAVPPPSTDKAAATPAATLPDAPKAGATATTPAVESELAEMRSLLRAQAAELEAQRRELAEMKAKMGSVKEEAVTAAVSAAVPAATAAVAADADGSGYTGGGQDKKTDSPLAIHFKGITITPGGFTAAETVYRNRSTQSDVNTAFTSIPYSASNLAHISEFNASGRQSRIQLKLDGKLASVKIGGYFEGDFLSAGTTSNDNESNSYTFRQRQFWGSAWFDSGVFFSGGQMWSLMTETKNGLENRLASGAENANTPMTIDAQYTAGFSWARQYGFRVVDRFFDKKLSLGFSVEGSQDRLTQHGGNLNFVAQAPGNTAGLFDPITSVSTANPQVAASQNYTVNPAPDFILKGALDPGWGHFELAGVIRIFRDRTYPCAVGVTAALPCPVDTAIVANSGIGASNDSRTGGFGIFNARVPVLHKKLDVGFHGLYGDGVGRYGTIGLADSTVRPNGTLAPIRGGQALGTLEWHTTPKLDIYAYIGGEYDSRAAYLTAFSPNAPVPGLATGATFSTGVGYGSPTLNNSGCNAPIEVLPNGTAGLPQTAGSCTADPRNVIEGTIGFWHRLYQGDRGRVQWGLQYSYVSLNAWSGTTGTPTATSTQFHPHTNDNMFFTSFRYYLP